MSQDELRVAFQHSQSSATTRLILTPSDGLERGWKPQQRANHKVTDKVTPPKSERPAPFPERVTWPLTCGFAGRADRI